LLMLHLMACADDQSRIEKCVEAELKVHPEAHLVDLYKYFFQDTYGPGHLVSDREGAEKYLDQELSSAERFEPFDYQELMYKEQFVRVNLRMIVDADISKQEYLNAFMKSAQEFKLPKIEEWRKEWAEIIKVIKRMKTDLPGYSTESVTIDSMLQSGNCVVHHSQDYIRAYDPHYRIICREQFKDVILKKITSGSNFGEGNRLE